MLLTEHTLFTNFLPSGATHTCLTLGRKTSLYHHGDKQEAVV